MKNMKMSSLLMMIQIPNIFAILLAPPSDEYRDLELDKLTAVTKVHQIYEGNILDGISECFPQF